MKTVLFFLFSLLAISSMAQPSIKRTPLTTNLNTGTYTNGQVPTYNASTGEWNPGNGGGASSSDMTNIVLSALTNANTLHVDKGGSDSTGLRGSRAKPFLTIRAAASNAVSGDLIAVHAGDYDQGTNVIVLPHGVSLCSVSGARQTVIRGSIGFSTNGPIVQAGSDSTVSGFRIICSGRTNYTQAGIGTDSRAGTRSFTNVVFQDLEIDGGSDACFIGHTNKVTAIFKNVWFKAWVDNVIQSLGGLTGATNSMLEFYNCKIETRHQTNTIPVAQNHSTTVMSEYGTIKLYGCEIICTGNTNSYAVYDGGLVATENFATNIIIGCRFEVSALTNANPVRSESDYAKFFLYGNQIDPAATFEDPTWSVGNISFLPLPASGTNEMLQMKNAGVLTGTTGMVYKVGTRRLGIGTNAPQNTLDVLGGIRASGLPGTGTNLLIDASGDFFRGNVGAGGGSTSPGGTNMQVQFNDGGSFNGATNFWYDKANQRVGIGTAAPLNTFHVDGDVRLTNLTSVGTSSGRLLQYREDALGNIDGRVGANSLLYFDNNQEALVLSGSGGTVLRFLGNSITEIASGILNLGANGDYWRIDSGGLLYPSTTNSTQDLGTSTFRPRNLYLGGDIALSSTSKVASATTPASNVFARTFTGVGTDPGLMMLRNSNLVGAVGFTHSGPSSASNIFDFAGITNPVAGQIFKIHSVAGNVVTLTNVADAGGSSGPLTNVVDLTFSGGTNVVVEVTNNVRTYRLFATNNFFYHLSAGAYDEQEIILKTTQDATGSRTPTYTNTIKFGTTIPDATLSTAPGLTDYIGLQWSAASNHWNTVRFVRGYPQ